MRSEKSVINSFSGFLQSLISILIGFIAQKIFLNILGQEYLGLNGLFNNIISMLSIAELGIGSAIIYNLYKPIYEKDKETLKSLMSFYKKVYRIIALVIFLLGLLIIPFLSTIVGENQIQDNINIIFVLFLIDVVCSYLLTYKRSILQADQNNYYINFVHIGYLIGMNVLQIIILVFTKNYYLYLIIKIIFRLLENIVLNLIVNIKYTYLKEKNIKKIDKNILNDIKLKIKGIIYHKFATFFVSGTDNILISYFFNVGVVGIYSSYYMIINSVNTLFSQVIVSVTSSVGNLLVSDDKSKKYSIYKKIRFFNVWLAIFSAVSIFVIMDSFITIWLGKQYLMSIGILLVLVINYYFQSTRSCFNVFQDAAGIYYEDRFVPLMESVANILFSIIFVKLFGLIGIFLGTIASQLILHFYSFYYFVYHRLFSKGYKEYLHEFFNYFVIFLLCLGLTYLVTSNIFFENNYLNFFKNVFFALLIPNLILLIIYRKNEEFTYFKDLFLKIFKKIAKIRHK